MKPAPFDYHAPATIDEVLAAARPSSTTPRCSPAARASSRCCRCGSRCSNTSSTSAASRNSAASNTRDGIGVDRGRRPRRPTVERDAEVARLGARCWRGPLPLIGHFQIRNRGTIGGSLAHADPASELPAVALALDAEFEAASVRGRRDIPAAEFFTGTWSTALDDDEILAGVALPDLDRPVRLRGRGGGAPPRRLRHRRRLRRPSRSTIGGDVERCAIGLFGLGSTPAAGHAAERSIVGAPASEVDAAGARSCRRRGPDDRSRPTSTGRPTTAGASARRSSPVRGRSRHRGGPP